MATFRNRADGLSSVAMKGSKESLSAEPFRFRWYNGHRLFFSLARNATMNRPASKRFNELRQTYYLVQGASRHGKYEYKRHRTLCLFGNFDAVSGKLLCT